MKKMIIAIGLLLGTQFAFAQAPEKMSYQAIIRNSSGQILANQNIGVKISILQGSPSGTAVFSERLTGTTNANGLVTMEIGTGTVLAGAFNTINWPSGSYYMKTETDPTGGTNYSITGTSQLLSVPYALFAKSAGTVSAGSFAIPFINTFTNAGNLFSITNDGDGASIEGINTTTTSNITSIKGVVNHLAPGGFSVGVKGVNSGTASQGIGTWGSHDGSGWGIYGSAPTGVGVYGNASGAGYGIYANSTSGTGLNATSGSGIAANVGIFNASNNNNVFNANTVGNGNVVYASTTGTGKGVYSSTGAGYAVHGATSSPVSAGIVGDNNGEGEAIVGRNTSDIAGAIVGRNDGGGYGIRGFVAGNTSGTGAGVLGQVGISGSKGRAGRFENTNMANDKNTLEASTNSLGDTGVPGAGAGLYAESTHSDTVAPAIRAKTNTVFANFGSSAVFAESAGPGGTAGTFHSSSATGQGNTLMVVNNGHGKAIMANASNAGNAIEANVNGTGKAIYGWVPSTASGQAADFQNFNASNAKTVLSAKTVANGMAGDFFVDNANGTSAALHGKVNSQFADFGTAGIYGESAGLGGYGGLFYASNASGNGPAIFALSEGHGNGITANAANDGTAIEATADGSGSAIYAWIPDYGTGHAAKFSNYNASNSNPTLTVESTGTGALAVFKAGNSTASPVNVARINSEGKAFFNGGTQNSGADIAEAFDVEGNISAYEPGDILVISTTKDRAVEKSSGAYSTLVAGVYATKPGVLLTEEHIDTSISDKVPMGVIGVIPTKVCLEGGKIKRGDLLVTSSKTGVGMKANLKKVKIGQVIGKALEDYDQNGTGKINVLVNIK
ncbi:collagen-like protein [uncultured Chryseobacterium sp.]|uniref:beta strand repeat-containing protein n=1 Tax=uncultured Chryseobacterium sp. TaxID=259322 RepID=UPI0025E9D46F|nr:collagen-like protein [uncultured Chryseobacterium sp.]